MLTSMSTFDAARYRVSSRGTRWLPCDGPFKRKGKVHHSATLVVTGVSPPSSALTKPSFRFSLLVIVSLAIAASFASSTFMACQA